MAEQSNNQLSTLISLEPKPQFKFHVLLECSETQMTTLGNEPLQFNPNTQKIVESTGEDFIHSLAKQIWDMVMKCKELGDGDMITVSVPFNIEEGFFDWEVHQTTKEASLWIRVFEVGSEHIAETEAIQANIDIPGRTYTYWRKMYWASRSDSEFVKNCDSTWKEVLKTVDEKLVEAKEKLAEAYKAWMKPTNVE